MCVIVLFIDSITLGILLLMLKESEKLKKLEHNSQNNYLFQSSLLSLYYKPVVNNVVGL